MIHNLLHAERRLNDRTEGCGMFGSSALDVPKIKPPQIVADGNRVALFPQMCGMFNPSTVLPLKFLQGLQVDHAGLLMWAIQVGTEQPPKQVWKHATRRLQLAYSEPPRSGRYQRQASAGGLLRSTKSTFAKRPAWSPRNLS